jgi:hypothetical protein
VDRATATFVSYLKNLVSVDSAGDPQGESGQGKGKYLTYHSALET